MQKFPGQLGELGVDWFPSIEASSVDLIETYVASGLGIGVSVAIPQKTLPPKVRALPLRGSRPCDRRAVARAQDAAAGGVSGGNAIARTTADVSGAMTGEFVHGLNRTTYQGCGPSETFSVALVVATSSAPDFCSQASSVVSCSFRLNPPTTTY